MLASVGKLFWVVIIWKTILEVTPKSEFDVKMINHGFGFSKFDFGEGFSERNLGRMINRNFEIWQNPCPNFLSNLKWSILSTLFYFVESIYKNCYKISHRYCIDNAIPEICLEEIFLDRVVEWDGKSVHDITTSVAKLHRTGTEKRSLATESRFVVLGLFFNLEI